MPSLFSHYRICVLTPPQSYSTHTVLLDLYGVPQMSFVCLIIQVTDNHIGSAQIQLESAWISSLRSPPGRCSLSLPGPQLALESTFTCAPAEPASLCNCRYTHTAIENRKKKASMICQVYFGTSIRPQLTFPHDFSFLFLPCSCISSHHCCKNSSIVLKMLA